jgi:hypothetical protein
VFFEAKHFALSELLIIFAGRIEIMAKMNVNNAIQIVDGKEVRGYSDET